MKQQFKITLLLLVSSNSASSSSDVSSSSGSGENSVVPLLTISECIADPIDWNTTEHISNFRLVDNSSMAIQQTFVSICYDNEYLNIRADCVDNNIVSPYQSCNQDLFNADVFEVFVSYGSGQPDSYLEIELSPYGVLFVSKVTNPNNNCPGIVDDLIDCGQSGIIYNATIFGNEWSGILQIPLTLIEKVTSITPSATTNNSNSNSNNNNFGPGSQWRINMFRIDIPLGQDKEYSCWNPTCTNPPCFHRPSDFGLMVFS
eukprot:gene5389-6722_t